MGNWEYKMRFYPLIAMIQRIVAIFFLILACNDCHTPSLWRDYGKEYCIEGNCTNGIGKSYAYLRVREDGVQEYVSYNGEWKEGKYHGKGFLDRSTMLERETYEGEFANDRYNGYGKWKADPVWPEEEKDSCTVRYEGDFTDGFPKGQGKLWTRDGKVYEGIFGNTFSAGGICYQGDCWNGKGSVIYFHGLHYRGDFKEGKPHGKGIKYDANNRIKYTGGFKEGRFHGMGVEIGYGYPEYTYGVWQVKANYIYEGNFANGNENGYGKLVFFYDNGENEVQEGEWYGGGIYCKGPKCGKALTGETAEESQQRVIKSLYKNKKEMENKESESK